ncbi:MAG: AbrB family transcriptional regulator [Gemmatimonas sp.]|nr:AbrB family transcriptional regulator [Gemmatimonas sp.]
MPTATMTSKGQITIPKTVREALGLFDGTRVDFEILPDGSALLRAKRQPLESIIGAFSADGIHVTVAQMDPGSLDA